MGLSPTGGKPFRYKEPDMTTTFKTFGTLFALVLIACAMLMLAPKIMEISMPVIETNAIHADYKHPEAEIIRKCYDNGDTFEVWMEPDKGTFHCLVKLPDGRTGDRIISKNWLGKSQQRKN